MKEMFYALVGSIGGMLSLAGLGSLAVGMLCLVGCDPHHPGTGIGLDAYAHVFGYWLGAVLASVGGLLGLGALLVFFGLIALTAVRRRRRLLADE